MSESIVPVAANRPDRSGSALSASRWPGSEVRLATDGELLLRGPGVFAGYLGEAGAENRLVDAEGFLATGDYASIDDDGFITLLGRKSELFKTSTGRRMAPGGDREPCCVSSRMSNTQPCSAPAGHSLVAVLQLAEAALQLLGERHLCRRPLPLRARRLAVARSLPPTSVRRAWWSTARAVHGRRRRTDRRT